MLKIVGDIGPPCGTPKSLGYSLSLSNIPAFSHCLTIHLSMGMLFNNQLWFTVSYALLMSTFKIFLFAAGPAITIHA